jgi:SOS-response transcriptional repressor LexA
MDTVHPTSIRRKTMQFLPSGTFPTLATPLFMEQGAGGLSVPGAGLRAEGHRPQRADGGQPARATYFVRAHRGTRCWMPVSAKGDMLVVDFSLQPKHGDIVIAKLDDSFTVKRLYTSGAGVVKLCPENKAANYPAITPQDGETLEVIGVVRWAVHQF